MKREQLKARWFKIQIASCFVALVLAVCLGLFLTQSAHADNTYYQFGAGVENNTQQSNSDMKFGEIGRAHEGKTFIFHYALGGWTDASHYPGAKDGYFATAMIGWEPKTENVYLHYLIGPAILYPTDTVLAGNFEFAQELGFGLRDVRNVRVGLAVRHFSNAGLVAPNLGRNFLVISVQN